jgi:hypothetical protein
MNAVQVSEHELRHVFGAAVGLTEIGTEAQYASALVHIHVGKDGDGEVAVQLDDATDTLQEKVAQLCASGPIAKAGPEILSILKTCDTVKIRAAGDLSAADEALIRNWRGPPLTPVLIALAVHELEKTLGFAKFSAMANTVRTMINQTLDDEPLPLSVYVPYPEAKKALASARAVLGVSENPRTRMMV